MQLKFISYYILTYMIIYGFVLHYNDYATLHYSVQRGGALIACKVVDGTFSTPDMQILTLQ